jgi:hypothetical protein
MIQPRICLTTLEFPPDVGGVGESVHRIAQMLIELGYEVHVAVFRAKHRFSEGHRRTQAHTALQDGIFVHRLQSANRLAEPTLQDFSAKSISCSNSFTPSIRLMPSTLFSLTKPGFSRRYWLKK